MILDKIKFNCHWNDKIVCENRLQCDECNLRPAPEDLKNGKKEPTHIRWLEGYDGDLVPECPECGENALANLDRCWYCGQKFIQDERVEKLRKSYETAGIEHMNCFFCGAENALAYMAASNGHKHGYCEKCGVSFME